MKSPDEIKKGLECCAMYSYRCEDDCPYREQCRNEQGGKAMNEDALALIQRLEAELEDMTARYKIADDCAKKKGEMNEKLYAELATVKAERDAALADFKLYRERNIKGECGVYACDLCKRGGRYEDWDEIKCPTGCSGVSHWQWRGVQKEE